jgi:predicted ATPase
VRIALHSGEATLRDGDYYGTTLNRVARILSLAHGGQVVISRIALEGLAGRLPAGASMRDLGIHSLRDLTRPEHLYQIDHADSINQFPPLRSTESICTNLPKEPDSFVGRRCDIVRLEKLLEEHRLVTIHGLGGSGKTRLAIKVAQRLRGKFRGGVWFCDLAALTDEHLVAQTIAEVLGLLREGTFSSCDPWLQRLAEKLEDREILLLLDNCEHVIGACAEVAKTLLGRAPHVRILATSREHISIAGECIFPLEPLRVPQANDDLDNIVDRDSVQLFLQRARMRQPDFNFGPENLRAVAEICRRLEGLPLGIELAAARLDHLSLANLAERLSGRTVLSTTSRSVPDRHRSLDAMLDWSVELLAPEERLLFARLSVFRGEFALRAVEEVCTGGPIEAGQLLDLLGHLVKKSLLRISLTSGETRYSMLESVREYAVEKARVIEDLDALEARHLKFCLRLVELAEPGLKGREQTRWLDALEAEFDTIRAALDHAIHKRDAEAAQRLGGGLWYFWFLEGHLSEGRRWLSRALALEGKVPAAVRCKALAGAGILYVLENIEKAQALLQDALHLARQQADVAGIGLAQFGLGWQSIFAGEWERTRVALTEGREAFVALGDTWGIGHVLLLLGVAVDALGDPASGEQMLKDAVAMLSELGNPLGVAFARSNYGEFLRAHGQDQQAIQHYERALSVLREIGERTILPVCSINLAMAVSTLGRYDQAFDLLSETLPFLNEGANVFLPLCLAGLGGVSVRRGELVRAAVLLGAAEAIGEQLGIGLTYADRVYYTESLEELKRSLNESMRLAAWTRGRGMTTKEIIAYASQAESKSYIN